MTLAEVQVKWSVILMERLGSDNFSTLQMKGHVLHRARAHLKVPGCSLVWNAFLTKRLPMFNIQKCQRSIGNFPGVFKSRMKWINSSYKLIEFLSGGGSGADTVYAPVCTTNPQIPIVICCIHLHIHHMSRILFLIPSFLDFVAFVVKTLTSP